MVDFAALDRTILQSLQMPDDASTYYTPLAGSRTALEDVIFRSPHEPITGTDLVFEGVGPMFSVHREDCPNLGEGDAFERASVLYVVTEVDKDEGYMWVAHCRLADPGDVPANALYDADGNLLKFVSGEYIETVD
jgi:hypothetical protein